MTMGKLKTEMPIFFTLTHHDFYRCPDPNILSPFNYNPLRGTAEATLYSMFKFPESKRAHFQCDIVICRGNLIAIHRGRSVMFVYILPPQHQKINKCPSNGGFFNYIFFWQADAQTVSVARMEVMEQICCPFLCNLKPDL